MTDPIPKPSKAAMRRRLIISLLAIPLGLVGLEGGIRYALFGESQLAHWMGTGLRNPSLFASQADASSDDFFKLRFLFTGNKTRPEKPSLALGWVSHNIHPVTLEHAHAEFAKGRRPLLVYGSSFSKYCGNTQTRYRTLLKETNRNIPWIGYAVGAHGMGQTLLMLEKTLPMFEGQNPIVAYTVMVDRDIDRAPAQFRQLPKPQVRLGPDGELIIEPIETTSPEEYVLNHPPSIKSYAWNYFLHGTGNLGKDVRSILPSYTGAIAQKRAILTKVLERAQATCNAQGVEMFVIVLQSQLTVTDSGYENWRHKALQDDLAQLGIPFVSTAPIMREAAEKQERPLSDFFQLEGPGKSHPNDLGMRTLFGAYERALDKDFDEPAAR